MLNKNDPLIGAVQEVMKKNQAERDAVRLVNEKFGVTDRKALPHEKQGEWDAAYKQVLSEGLHPNQQKLDVHEPEKDKLTAQDFKMLRSKKKPMEEENAPKTDPYAEGQASSISTVSQPKKEVTPADQSALKKKIMSIKEAKANPYAIGMAAVKKSTGDEPPMEKKNIMKAHKIAKKIIAKKKMNEGFNNRHGLSVTASAEKQAVAELNERLVDNRQRTSRLAPMHTQGIKQTRARLAREPVEPKRSFSQKAAEFGRGVEATARGVAAGVTDLGQTSFGYKPLSDYALDAITPGRGEKLKQEFPTISNVSKDAASIASIATGAPGLVKGGLKYGAKKFIKSKADDLAKTTTALPKSTKPVSQAAREPAAVPTAAAKVASKPAKPVSQAVREPDEIIMPAKKPDIPSGNAGIRGTFQDKLARARQNAGSDLKARQLPALRRTTEPTNYVRPGVPAVRPASGPNLPARPGSPNLAAGGATRIVGLSNKAKAGLAAGAAGAAIGGYALNRSLSGNQLPAAQASTTPVAPANAASPQAMAAGAERDKVGVKRIQPVTKPATATTQSVPVPKPKPAQTQAQPQVTKKPAAPAPEPQKKPNALQQQMARSKSGRDEPAGPRKDAQGLNVHSMTRPQPGKPGVRK